MNNSELNQVMVEISDRWEAPSSATAGDLRSALEHFEYDIVCVAIREVSLQSNFKRLPVGKLMDVCKKKGSNSDPSKKSIPWDIFVQNTKYGHFHQVHTRGDFTPDQAMKAAEEMRDTFSQQLNEEYIVVRGATISEMFWSRARISKDFE